MDERTRKAVRSILSPHGLEQLVGSDIAAVAIPAAAAVNVNLLDAAAGYFLANPGGPVYISQGAVFDRATGQWNAESGVTQATMVMLDAGDVFFYSWAGAAGAANITWTGGSFGQAVVARTGYIRLGAITLIWGTNDITTGGAGQTTLFIPYPITVSGTLVVMATLNTTDNSVVWLATNNYATNGFLVDVYRNADTGFLDIGFTWLAVAQT